MNIAIIFAGGTGKRMNNKEVPKQFLMLDEKPIIIHTIERFDKHKDIDHIVIVCLKKWIDYLESTISQFNITKVVAIVPGGKSGQQSIFYGLQYVKDNYDIQKPIVLIHDGVRPLVDSKSISDSIKTCKQKGNAIVSVPSIETVFIKKKNQKSVKEIIDRNDCMMARAPQCFYLNDIYKCHIMSNNDGIEFIDSATLMQYYGHKLNIVEGNPENIKITTPIDYFVFKGIYENKKGKKDDQKHR